jgi:cytoskeletal protein CcmA (bactofilin family)
MLLTRLLRRSADDRGAALAAVLGLMAVSLITSTLIVGSVITTTGLTTANRANVQSQAAAEAGIAAARAGLIAGTCSSLGGVYESAPGATPEYFATVWMASGSTWVRACPTNTASRIRILSTGTAAAQGVAGAEGRDQVNVEAILSAVVNNSAIAASGPAVYAYRSDGFGGSGTLVSVNNSSPSVLVKEGDVACSGSSAGPADWVIDNGNLTISGSCNIAGNAWASKLIALSGSVQIGGNAVGQAISVAGSSKILGSTWATTSITTSSSSTISGNATAASLSHSGTINGNAWIYGAATLDNGSKIAGKLTAKTKSGKGTVGSQQLYNPATPPASPYLTPARPFVPNWVDFAYDPADWPGFTIVTLSGTCNDATLLAALTTIGTNAGVIDARACSAPSGSKIAGTFSLSGGTTFTLKNDLAIIANGIDLQGSGGFVATASQRLWLIIPDTVVNHLPDCPTSGGKSGVFDIAGTIKLNSPISTMMYTPCAADIGSGLYIQGQLFAGYASIGGSAQIGYVAVGLPGYNLSTGEDTTVSPTEAQRTVESIRNVTESN